MYFIKKGIFILCLSFFLFITNKVSAQKINTDSLWRLVTSSVNDSTKYLNLNALRDATFFSTDEILHFAKKEIAYGEKFNDKAFLAYGNILYANFYSRIGDYIKAQEFVVKASAIIERMSRNENFLAVIYNIRGNNERDIKKKIVFLKRGIDIGKDDFFKRVLYYNISSAYLEINQIDSALFFAQKSNEVGVKYHDTLTAYRPTLFGRIYLKLNQIDIAYAYFREALRLAEKSNSVQYHNVVYNGITRYFRAIGNEDSILVYKKRLFEFNTPDAYPFKVAAADFIYKYYLKTGNKDSVIKYLTFNKIGNDSLNSLQKIETLQLAKISEEFRQKEVENKLEEEKNNRNHNIQLAFTAIAILSGIILFLLLSRSILVSHKVVEFLSVIILLVVFEFINLLIHPWLEKVTHHSPALMLLALVAIAALIVPLHHKLEHWTTKKLVEKNKAVRLANAKKTIEELSDQS